MRDEIRRVEQEIKELKIQIAFKQSKRARTRRYRTKEGGRLRQEIKALGRQVRSKQEYIDNLYSMWLKGDE